MGWATRLVTATDGGEDVGAAELATTERRGLYRRV
jgi:hypothetical protein